MFCNRRRLALGFVLVVVSLSSAVIEADDRFMPEWTFTEVLNKHDAAVIARRETPASSEDAGEKDPKTARFVVIEFLKGDESLSGEKVDAQSLPGETGGELFLLVANRNKSGKVHHWRVARPVTQAYQQHVLAVSKLETTGAERLAFFQPLLEHADESVAANAHLEFVVAPYEAFFRSVRKTGSCQNTSVVE